MTEQNFDLVVKTIRKFWYICKNFLNLCTFCWKLLWESVRLNPKHPVMFYLWYFVQSGCKGFSAFLVFLAQALTIPLIKQTNLAIIRPFDQLPQVHLWFRLWQYHWSYKHTVKFAFITLYNYTLHCTISTRAPSIRRQQRKRTSEES